MAKTKISEFSATPGNNTDIDGINIAEGCAPSGINDAIRELMAQLKDFQAGTAGDSFNGPVGTTTAAAGAFTTLSSTGNTTLGDAAGDTVTVNGTATFANANPTLSAGTANGVAYLNGSKVLTTGSALVFDGSNLGLGATPSGKSKFEVATGNAAQNGVQVWYNSSNTPIALANTTSNAFPYVGFNTVQKTSSDGQTYAIGNYASRLKAYGGGFSFDIAASGSAGADITWTQAMTLDASGNLGIGTTSPACRLEINNGTSVAEVRIGDTSGRDLVLRGGTASTELQVGSSDSRNLTFITNDTERARIDSSGNLLVGTTTGGTGSIGFQIGANGYTRSVQSASTNGITTWDTYSTGAGAYRFYVGMGGTIYATSTTITAISDQRLKENIQDIDVGLDAVMALKPRKFDWKQGKGKDKKGDRGWIAQEFEQVFPDMIDEWRDPAPEGEEPYKAVNADLIPVLVKALQELNAKVEAQAAEIAALKSK